ncbi:MAG: hypothetical protein A2580_16915 [Hydrogenophilales bacterium RIFOXYD1_FULL_62_11]|nr:MAG: hypothetical protein A2580_16915 [Hydrogenophilales bacterium RIFOXYD1_FULL_62_11]
MLLAGLGIAVDYRMSIPGSSLVDRLRAKPVVLDVDSLSGENQLSIKQTYHHLRYTCAPEHGILGDFVCWATVSDFNGIDARLIAFFFRNDKLSSVRVSFSAEDHPKMLSLMQKRFGPERRFGQRTDAFGNNIVGWIRPSGIVAINDSADGNEEPFLLWTSADTILKKVLGTAPGR